MAVGEVYQIKVNQVFQAVEESVTSFFYQQTGGPTVDAAGDLRDAFVADVFFNMLNMQDPAIGTPAIVTTNIARPSDFTVAASGGTGGTGIAGAPIKPYICLALRSPTPSPGLRYSYLRIPGQNIGMLTGTFTWSPAYRLEVKDFTDSLALTLEQGGNTFSYVQVASGWSLGVPPVVNRSLAGEWTINVHPATQNSRKDAYYTWVAP